MIASNGDRSKDGSVMHTSSNTLTQEESGTPTLQDLERELQATKIKIRAAYQRERKTALIGVQLTCPRF